jgi:putative membrane protein
MTMDHRPPASPEKQAPVSEVPDDSRATDYLANERTMLAWSRTGVAVMALGFVVARFGLVLRELRPGEVRPLPQSISTAFGVALVLAGTVLLLLASIRYVQIGRDIGTRSFRWSPRLGLCLAIVLLLAGVLLAVYLLLTG